MSTKIAVGSATLNPAQHLTLTTERDRKAKLGCIGEWDMATFSSGTVMTDLSGKGNHFTLISAASVGATGVTFNGANYADVVLPAALLDNYSFLVVAKAAAGGFYAFGSANLTDIIGATVRLSANRMDLYVGQAANSASGPACTTVAWGAGLFTVEKLTGRARSVAAGRLATNHTIVFNTLPDTRARWRLGAKASTVGSDHDVADGFLPAGTIVAYAMLFNRVVGYAQSLCLHEYVKAKMTARGITYT